MTWVLFSGSRFSSSEIVCPSLHHPCRSLQKRQGPGPSDSPKRRPDAGMPLLIMQRFIALRGDHQLRIRTFDLAIILEIFSILYHCYYSQNYSGIIISGLTPGQLCMGYIPYSAKISRV